MFSVMKLRMPHIRKIARLLAGVFAVQVIAAGACLMVPAAQAMPMTGAVSVMEHCDNMDMAMDQAMGSAAGQHGHHPGCPHCDQPDSIAGSHVSIDHTPLVLALLPADVDVAGVALAQPALTVRVPTGPPRSASLIFQTTQRIRI